MLDVAVAVLQTSNSSPGGRVKLQVLVGTVDELVVILPVVVGVLHKLNMSPLIPVAVGLSELVVDSDAVADGVGQASSAARDIFQEFQFSSHGIGLDEAT